MRCLEKFPCRDITFANIDVTSTEPFLCKHVHAEGLPQGWECPAEGETHKAPRTSEFRLSNTLGSHMVLQRDSAATCVWGFSGAGDVVVTRFQGKGLTTTADSSGVWRQFLPPQPATMQPQTLSFTSAGSGAHLSITDVLFGDVFLAGGQSNMAVTVNYTFGGQAEIALAEAYPFIRLFTVGFFDQRDPARRAQSAPRSLRHVLLMPQVNPGSLYRCGKRD